MTNSISELKKQWDKEAESYKIQEVGSGVQRFVKQVLKSEIFNLSEGDLATNDLIMRWSPKTGQVVKIESCS